MSYKLQLQFQSEYNLNVPIILHLQAKINKTFLQNINSFQGKHRYYPFCRFYRNLSLQLQSSIDLKYLWAF